MPIDAFSIDQLHLLHQLCENALIAAKALAQAAEKVRDWDRVILHVNTQREYELIDAILVGAITARATRIPPGRNGE